MGSLSVTPLTVWDPRTNTYYVPQHTIRETIAPQSVHCAVRSWFMRRKPKAIKFGARTNPVWKVAFTHTEVLAEFIERLHELGFEDPRPGSWAWPWYRQFRIRASRLSTRHALARHRGSRAHSWQEGLRRGELPGTWHQYDINGAYSWAASLGLPNPTSLWHVNRVVNTNGGGLYYAKVRRWGVSIVPPHLRKERATWVTDEELHQLDAHGVEVEHGLAWRLRTDMRPQLDWIRESFTPYQSRKILQRFWGGYMSNKGPTERIVKQGRVTYKRRLRSQTFQPVWGLFLMSRAALRCAEYASDASHVYVDSVILPYEIPTGSRPGEWRHVDTYQQHWVGRTGKYGNDSETLKQTGVKKDDAYRIGASGIEPWSWRGLGLSDAAAVISRTRNIPTETREVIREASTARRTEAQESLPCADERADQGLARGHHGGLQ